MKNTTSKKFSNIRLCDIELLNQNSDRKIRIKNRVFRINELTGNYSEGRFRSKVVLCTEHECFIVKKLRSIWEFLPISTYDHLEKREDNKLYDLFYEIKYLKEKNEV